MTEMSHLQRSQTGYIGPSEFATGATGAQRVMEAADCIDSIAGAMQAECDSGKGAKKPGDGWSSSDSLRSSQMMRLSSCFRLDEVGMVAEGGGEVAETGATVLWAGTIWACNSRDEHDGKLRDTGTGGRSQD